MIALHGVHTGVIIVSETEFRVVEFPIGERWPIVDGLTYSARQCGGSFDGGVKRGFVLLLDGATWPSDPRVVARAQALAMADAEVIGP